MRVTIHHAPQIKWQRQRVNQLATGLRAIGLKPYLTDSPSRWDENPAIVLGTTFFHAIEQDEYPSMLVDRASWGDPHQVQLVWNGRLRRGDHRVPESYMSHAREFPIPKDRQDGERVVLCGQVGNNGADIGLRQWYESRESICTHYRQHPADQSRVPLSLPITDTWDDTGLAVTLNSSVGVWCLLHGIDVLADDPGAMLHPYSQGDMNLEECLNWIAWTQWSWDEIEAGEPIRHHFYDGEDYRF